MAFLRKLGTAGGAAAPYRTVGLQVMLLPTAYKPELTIRPSESWEVASGPLELTDVTLPSTGCVSRQLVSIFTEV